MATVFLGLGSNHDRERNLCSAIELLHAAFGSLQRSSVYESAPHGHTGASYFNLVVMLESNVPVAALKQQLREIEARCGRDRDGAPGVCALDIDLLLYGDQVGVVDGIELPHRDVLSRAYVLQPLAELAPNYRHPVERQTFSILWQRFPVAAPMRVVRLDCEYCMRR